LKMATLKEAIDIARKEPNSERSKLLLDGLKSGKFDRIAEQEGLDLGPFKQKISSVTPQVEGVLGAGFDQGAKFLGGVAGSLGSLFKGGYDIAAGGLKTIVSGATGDQQGVQEGIKQFTEPVISAGKTVADVASRVVEPIDAGIEGLKALPEFARLVTGQGTREDYETLDAAAKRMRKSITGAVGLVPTPPVQALVGFTEQSIQSLEEGKPPKEALTKGVVEGAGRAALMGIINKLTAPKLKTKVTKEQIAERAAKENISVQAARKGLMKEEVAGRIVQGKIKDRPKAVKALSEIDTKGVANFDQLQSRFNSRVKDLSTIVDDLLDQDITVFPREKLTVSKMVGEIPVVTSFIDDSLTALGEFYDDSLNAVGKQKIENLMSKLNTQGLTKKEINDISIEFGNNFSQKSFTDAGARRYGVTADKAENIRKGLKDTVIELSDEATASQYSALEESMSNLIRSRELVETAQEKANQLRQTFRDRKWGEQFTDVVFEAVDFFLGGGLRGILSKTTRRGKGLKVLNKVELEQNLSKMIRLMDKIDKASSFIQVREAVNALAKFLSISSFVVEEPEKERPNPEESENL